MDDVARELAWQPVIVERLLELHVSDGHGHGRCRGCTASGTGWPSGSWPCVLYLCADSAARFGQARARSTGPLDGAER